MTSDFRYHRPVDLDRFAALGPDERLSQKLLSRADGAQNVSVSYVRTPAGGGSPEGLHVHEVEQVFYVVAGTMSIEVDGDRFDAGPGSLVVFPAGVPHRNWNGTDAETVHLNICAPAPDPDQPFARRVG
ncbi:cupin domain-containing protein [Jiangella mangrovi]|uniref:Mannose-6-phosphate isomerase-like protein (Cupin superfamily) n=1 Tax=Jiangella mangrovi TaxID=1524084 RepID=A0A7W9GNQ6_9ACTN|nr:cupin domain-containing protein [Jiangella mangrovi]MBB5787249.1 mannose-6-phosphate isomerase-like protein (cupin superfamily) [Jiangella mangrovi]